MMRLAVAVWAASGPLVECPGSTACRFSLDEPFSDEERCLFGQVANASCDRPCYEDVEHECRSLAADTVRDFRRLGFFGVPYRIWTLGFFMFTFALLAICGVTYVMRPQIDEKGYMIVCVRTRAGIFLACSMLMAAAGFLFLVDLGSYDDFFCGCGEANSPRCR